MMKNTNTDFEKCKGLKNGKEWVYGVGKIYNDGLAVVQNGNNRFYVFKDSLSSSTGFHNSMGQEIYGGDLLEAHKIDGGRKTRFVQQVVWDHADQQWKVEYFFNNKKIIEALGKNLDQPIIGHVFSHQYLINPRLPKVRFEYGERAY
jgi:hypothetical protein